MQNTYDVLVVGAGPSGLAFARVAKESRPHLKLAVLEKYRFPRDKICGDGLTFLTKPLLESIFPDVDLHPHASANAVLSLRVPFGRGWYQFRHEVDVIPRKILDATLAQAVRADGIPIFENRTVVDVIRSAKGRVTGVKVKDERGETHEVFASLVVGADGSSGSVRRKTGPVQDDRMIFAIRQYYRGVACSADGLVFDLKVQGGYGYFWVFPFSRAGEGWANIGFGAFSPSLVDLKRNFDAYKKRPEIAKYLTGAKSVGKPEAFPLHLAKLKGFRLSPSRLSYGDGFVLVGDAAGLIHPYSGEGIAFALASGALAARTYFPARDPNATGRAGADQVDAQLAGLGPIYERELRSLLKPTHQVPLAYALLHVPEKLPTALVKPYLDWSVGTMRFLRKISPRLLGKDVVSAELERLRSEQIGEITSRHLGNRG